jgi:hypothetical protein
MGFLRGVPGSDTDTCCEGYSVDIKAENVTDIQEDEHPVLKTFPVAKDEHEVCLCVHC